MKPAKEVVDTFDRIPDHTSATTIPMASTATTTADKPPTTTAPDGGKEPDKDDKKRKIPPIVFVPLLGAFLVITIVPSVVSNVINKSPAPTPAPAPATNSGGGGNTGFGEGVSTPTPAPVTTSRAPSTPAPTPSGPPVFGISTVLQSPVWDIGFHPPTRTFLGINDSMVWTWALPTTAATTATTFNGIARGGRRVDSDAAGNVYIQEFGASDHVVQMSAASNFGTATTLATSPANLALTAVLVTPASAGMDVLAATNGGALVAWNTSALTSAGIEVVAPDATTPFLANDMVYRDGYIYIVDTPSSCIRRVALSTGVADVLAGQCFTDGYADGPAASSSWKRPTGITMDFYGDLYISDTSNHVIRKINMTTNIVTTIAGTAQTAGLVNSATNASLGLLNAPQGLAIDPTLQWKATPGSFALYVADSSNNCVRKITWG